MRKSIKESDYILQFDEFSSLMKKEDVIVKVAKNGYVFFADDETLGNNLLGFINPNTSNQKLHIKVPVSTVASLDEFENTKELVDFIISEYSHYKRKFESKKSARKSIKESKSDLLIDIQNLISSSGLLDSIADVEDTLEIAYMIAERLDPSDYGFKDEDALANKINFELKYDREYAKLFESKKFVRKSIKEEYDPTDDIINKGNSVGMDYETFLEFAEKQDYKFNVTDATFYFGINSNIKIEGRECSCIPSEDGILIIDNHSSIEIPRKDIDEVSGVSLNSKNILRMDVFTKDSDVLTVWWEL